MSLLLLSSRMFAGDDEQDIRSCFEGYRSAILAAQGEKALDWVDKSTIRYYERMLELVFTADKTTVEQLGFMDRMMVLTIRYRVDPELLRRMDGKSLFIYAVNQGMIGKNSVSGLELGNVKVSGDSAKGIMESNGQASPYFFQFDREADGWKIDLTSVMKPAEDALCAYLKAQDIQENDFIFMALEMLGENPPGESLWDPVSPK
ncbi:MAG: hypothetical protein JW801_15990 [Bacteroidales bacterium]|nr:hypothetical protein [Bacteroidales bacterium]